MAIRKPTPDDRGVEREDEIQNPRGPDDIDEIGAATGDADRDDQENEDDDAFEDDETDDEEIEEEDVE